MFRVLNTTSTIFSDIQSDVRLTLVRVSGASGAPAWIWNHLAWKAVDEGADFLYQVCQSLSSVPDVQKMLEVDVVVGCHADQR